MPAYIYDTGTAESLLLDLIFHTGFPGVVRILLLKTFFALITAATLCPVFTATVFHQVNGTAMTTRYLDIFHNDGTIPGRK
ncbi:hypothetical protein [Candidatus Electronema sp. JM]|uniref:hypothetical protein n=1 Tax=Candidatus Electronema sp. JM TaxID=3401571 RepID=UPI003AA99100